VTTTEKEIYRVFIRGSIQAVWREITKTDEIQGAMFNMRLHTTTLGPGAPVRMRSANGKFTAIVGDVLEFNPPHRYAHTFRFTNYDDPPCKVIFDLKEVEGGVEFTMTLEDVPAGTKTAKQMKQGSQMIVNSVKAIVETGRPSLGTRLLYRLIRALEFLNPKRTRSENWPL
jgi:uncharacterized protein YndB with AHSA1/START domain